MSAEQSAKELEHLLQDLKRNATNIPFLYDTYEHLRHLCMSNKLDYYEVFMSRETGKPSYLVKNTPDNKIIVYKLPPLELVEHFILEELEQHNNN